ncbi:FtsX-like permease family protein [Rehaibacterium terrae]|uniref:Putative ABC transport system permease protein n=1 Tax=Rehaibacterium terrae TaxID=1341696 RepID=A0A7W7V6Q3_9GAMM|nr:putative ABC transport system permease protein [Rehaibacterium terrae]
MTPLHRKLLRELRQLRGQVLAIALVMVGGIGTMVMALTNYDALADTRALYYGEYRFAEVFARVKRAPLPLAGAVRAIPGVREVEPRVVGFASLEVEGFDEPVTGQIVSLSTPEDPGLNRLYLREGRLPLADDEVVLGEAFAQAHGLRPGDGLVAILNGRRQALRVSGVGASPEFVYPIRPGDVFPDFERYGVLWMPREPLAMAFDMDGAFNDLAITLARDAREADVIDALDALLAPYGGVGAHGRDLQMSHRFLSEELNQLQMMTRFFTVIFLGVSAFLLNVVVGRLVATQREQIAVLKAFGYSRWEVGLHYGQLVLLMVLVGVLPGVALGAWLGRGMADLYMTFFRFPFLAWSLSPSVLALAFGFAIAAAAFGTLGALRRAFALPPAEAMRPEAPPVFRRTLTERLGLGVLLDPPARMILRNLERRPLRTTLSVIGIGLACGILVMSRFQSAAIEEMIEVQFGFAQRDDLAVTFAEPASWRAAEELAALPGVRAVEPFRAAAVNLRHGHRHYHTALQGLDDDTDLKRVLDDTLQPARLPAEGLLLTDYLADLLGARPGDTLDVEFLEGHRRTLRVPLAGTVREYLGVGAYARRDTVNRLLGEGDALSGAWLAIDPPARLDVVSALRERPRVAAITDRAAMVQSFRDTLAENILAFTLIATLMAGSIAVGVVYNAARITLAERGRELASLRVLGYTRAEVRALLLGELGALSFFALLPGFALGYGMAALLVWGFRSDLYRIPLVIAPGGYAFAGLVVLAATVLSAWLVRRRLDRLDLVAVLKTKE